MLGCHHEHYVDDGGIAFGLNLGGYFCPVARANLGQQGFWLESEDEETLEDDTSEDDIIFLKTLKTGGEGKFSVFCIRYTTAILTSA